MNGYWQNLRPFERRVLVIVAALFFVVLNFLFVLPYFSEWDKVQERRFQANRKLGMYNKEIAETNQLWVEVRRMESAGAEVPAEDQARHFANTINAQAGQSGVQLMSGGKTTTSTNQPFFIELSQTVGAQSPEPPLVDFLFNLGSGNSLIRVRDLNLRPDPQRQQIVSTITLVASYQKKAPAKPAATTPGKRAPGSPAATSPLAEAPGGKTITSTKK